MSIRVHELAKELGLKSQELLDRIQKWGLEVKSSTFAGLSTEMVTRIRELNDGANTSSPRPDADTERPGSSPKSKPPSPVEISPIPSTATAEPRLSPPPAPATTPEPSVTAHPATAVKPAHAPVTTDVPPVDVSPVPPKKVSEAPALPVTPVESATLTSAPSAPNPTTAPPVAPANTGLSGRPAGAPRAPGAGAPPISRVSGGGMANAPRSGAGPLSGHTSHRGGQPQAGGPPLAPRLQQGAPSAGGGYDPRPNPTSPSPLRHSDYISPGGVRSSGPPPLQSRTGQGSGSTPPRRTDGNDISRQQGPLVTRRPLPQVAAPSTAPLRRPEPPRPAGPESKSQRPEVRYTPEQLRAMMQQGQLGTSPPPAPGRPGTGLRPGDRGPVAPRSGFAGGPNPGSGPMSARGPSAPPGSGAPALRRPPAPGTAPLTAPPAITPTIDEDEDRKGKGAAGRLGTPADRAGRRAKRNERAADRRVSTSPVPVNAILAETEEETRRRGGGRRGQKGSRRAAQALTRKSHAEIVPPINMRTLSEAIGVKANELIRKMMNSFSELVTINANLDAEMAQMLALEFGVELEILQPRTAEDDMIEALAAPREDAPEKMVPRPPIITILGHVDHGKTSLLDKIRKADVAAHETGGITQHIGAYQIEHEGKMITFVDTPGHEAFTAMRARGANVTDIVVLVVAADDGVMPQTQEAIAHAKAAGVPIVVALNKIDLPNVNLNKIYGELSQQELVPEEYGGDTPVVKTSATTGKGIPELLEMLGIVAELKDLRANVDRPASGTCLEASISDGRGVVATILVQDGTLKVGDSIVCGDAFGKVRALFDDKGRSIQVAGPSTPVEVSGLDEVPNAGEKFAVLENISRAREIASRRRERSRGVQLGERDAVTLENLFSRMAEQKVKNLNLILKADVQGSLEALVKELDKLENAEVPIRILLKGVGGISESDILLADASQAIVIGFRVAPEDRAVTLAEEKKIDIRRYDIIYQVTDEVKKAVEGMLVPEIKEVHLGRAVVRQTFKISKVGTVAGCFVTQGSIERSAKARVIREGREIYKGAIEALKRFKDDVKEVAQNFECGIKVTNFDDLKTDDIVEAYRIDVIRRTL